MFMIILCSNFVSLDHIFEVGICIKAVHIKGHHLMTECIVSLRNIFTYHHNVGRRLYRNFSFNKQQNLSSSFCEFQINRLRSLKRCAFCQQNVCTFPSKSCLTTILLLLAGIRAMIPTSRHEVRKSHVRACWRIP